MFFVEFTSYGDSFCLATLLREFLKGTGIKDIDRIDTLIIYISLSYISFPMLSELSHLESSINTHDWMLNITHLYIKDLVLML